MNPFLVIKRSYHSKSEEEYHEDNYDMKPGKSYNEYIEKYGYHFTDKLAEHASKMLKNSNGVQHSWSVQQIKKQFEDLGLHISGTITLGDMTYATNMYYSDFYPDIMPNEIACAKAAHKMASDIDGYEGIIFCRWLCDIENKHVEICWEDFI